MKPTLEDLQIFNDIKEACLELDLEISNDCQEDFCLFIWARFPEGTPCLEWVFLVVMLGWYTKKIVGWDAPLPSS